jgi:hypothetical protein
MSCLQKDGDKFENSSTFDPALTPSPTDAFQMQALELYMSWCATAGMTEQESLPCQMSSSSEKLTGSAGGRLPGRPIIGGGFGATFFSPAEIQAQHWCQILTTPKTVLASGIDLRMQGI